MWSAHVLVLERKNCKGKSPCDEGKGSLRNGRKGDLIHLFDARKGQLQTQSPRVKGLRVIAVVVCDCQLTGSR